MQQLLMGNNALFTGKKDSGYSASFGGQSQQHKGTGSAQIIFKSMHHWMKILANNVNNVFSMTQCVTLIEGDGIGPEISAALVKVFAAAQVRRIVS